MVQFRQLILRVVRAMAAGCGSVQAVDSRMEDLGLIVAGVSRIHCAIREGILPEFVK